MGLWESWVFEQAWKVLVYRMWTLHSTPVTCFLCCSENSPIRVWIGSRKWYMPWWAFHPVLELSDLNDVCHQGLWGSPRICLGPFPSLRSLECPRTFTSGIQGRMWWASQDGKERCRVTSTPSWQMGEGSLSLVHQTFLRSSVHQRASPCPDLQC